MSSLTTEAGRSTTSPAEILSIVFLSRRRMDRRGEGTSDFDILTAEIVVVASFKAYVGDAQREFRFAIVIVARDGAYVISVFSRYVQEVDADPVDVGFFVDAHAPAFYGSCFKRRQLQGHFEFPAGFEIRGRKQRQTSGGEI
jgi:hypothetical protein